MSELSLEFTAALKLETYIKHCLPRQKMQMKIWNHIMIEICMTTNMISEVSFLWFTGPERMHRNMMEIKLEIWFQNHGICQGCVYSQGVNAPHLIFLFSIFWTAHIVPIFKTYLSKLYVFVEIAKCICQNPHQGCVHSQSEDAKRRISHSFNEIFWKRNRPGKYKYML